MIWVAIGVAGVVAACLWGLFRRGSMAHRARNDYSEDGYDSES